MMQRYCNTRVGSDSDHDRLLAALPSQPETISPLLPLNTLVVLARTQPHKSVGMTGNSPTLPFSHTKWRIPSFHGGFPAFSPLFSHICRDRPLPSDRIPYFPVPVPQNYPENEHFVLKSTRESFENDHNP